MRRAAETRRLLGRLCNMPNAHGPVTSFRATPQPPAAARVEP